MSWRSFSGVWVTASLLRCPRLSSVFVPNLPMLCSGWFWCSLGSPIPLFSFLVLGELFQAQQIQLISASPSSSIYIFSTLVIFKYLSTLSLSFIFALWSAETAKFTEWQVIFFLLINARSGHLAWIKWFVFISKFQRICQVLYSFCAMWLAILSLSSL